MAADVIELNGIDFDGVISGSGFAAVYFGSKRCGPCKEFKPVFYEAASESVKDGLVFAAVDADLNLEIALRCRATRLPTVCLFKDGEIIGRLTGAGKKKDIFNFIEKYIK